MVPKIEKPPALTGHPIADIKAIWSYLYKLAETLNIILEMGGKA